MTKNITNEQRTYPIEDAYRCTECGSERINVSWITRRGYCPKCGYEASLESFVSGPFLIPRRVWRWVTRIVLAVGAVYVFFWMVIPFISMLVK